jgi:hypothetical protein
MLGKTFGLFVCATCTVAPQRVESTQSRHTPRRRGIQAFDVRLSTGVDRLLLASSPVRGEPVEPVGVRLNLSSRCRTPHSNSQPDLSHDLRQQHVSLLLKPVNVTKREIRTILIRICREFRS